MTTVYRRLGLGNSYTAWFFFGTLPASAIGSLTAFVLEFGGFVYDNTFADRTLPYGYFGEYFLKKLVHKFLGY